MSKQRPEWFLAQRNIKPNSTIVLGSIIADPRYPTSPPTFKRLPIESDIQELNYTYTHTATHSKGGKVGIFLHFLSLVGVGTDIDGTIQLDDSLEINADNLQTLTFQPNSAYIQRVLDLPDNIVELDGFELRNKTRSFGRTPLYVVTGVQVAYGASWTVSSGREWSAEASVGVSPNVPGVEVGGRAGVNRGTGMKESVGKHDFVYAFKLNRINYSRKKAAVGLEKYVKGAVFGEPKRGGGHRHRDDGDGSTDAGLKKRHGDEGKAEWEVSGVQSGGAGRNEFGVEGIQIGDEDDEESCIVIDPSKIQDSSDEEDEDDD